MFWFRKKKTFAITYLVHGFLTTERRFIIKAADIAEASKKIQDKEVYPISIIEWKFLD